MTNEDAIKQLTAIKGQNENIVTALGAAIDVLTNGYKSDKGAIDAANANTAIVQAKLNAVKESIAAV